MTRMPYRLSQRLVVSLLISIAAHTAVAANRTGPHASDLLYHMAEATRSLHYTGTFVYQRGNQIDSMKIVHRGEGGGDDSEYERMISLSGPAREVIRDGSKVVCIYADNRSVIVEKSPSSKYFPLALSGSLDSINEIYQINVEGEERVAGRETWSVAIRPVDTDRYGYVIWVDRDSNLPLKSTVVDHHKTVLEQVQFTSITVLDAIPDDWLEPEYSSAGYSWYANTKPDSENDGEAVTMARSTAGWTIEWLPVGFKMLEAHEQMVSASRVPVRHWVYSDGLAMVSVFIEKLDDVKIPLRGYSSRGAVNALGRVEQDYQVTVVGEIPLDTLQRIAASIVHRSSP